MKDLLLLKPGELDQACEAVQRLDPRDALVLACQCIVHARKHKDDLDYAIVEAIEAADGFVRALIKSVDVQIKPHPGGE